MGIFLIFLSVLSVSISSYFGKVAINMTEMSGIINSFSRFIVGTIGMLAYMISKRKKFKANNMRPILKRAITNSFAIMLFFMSVRYTTITNANMLSTVSVVFVILISPYYFKDSIKKSTYLYLGVIMTGAYIVSNPSFGNVNIGDVLALASALFAAFSRMYLKKSREEDEGYIIVFYVMVIGTIINFPFAYRDVLNFDTSAFIPVLLAGLLGFMGQIFITAGYKYVDPATGSMIATSKIVLGGIIGYLFLNEPINARIILGMTLITVSLISLSGYFDRFKNKLNTTKDGTNI